MRTTRRPRCPKHPLLQPRSPRLRRDYFPTFCHHHSSHIQLLILFSSNEVHLVPPVLQHIYLELGVLCSKSRPRPRFCIIARCCSRFALLEMGVWCPVSYSLDPFGCFHGHELRPRLCRTPVGITRKARIRYFNFSLLDLSPRVISQTRVPPSVYKPDNSHYGLKLRLSPKGGLSPHCPRTLRFRLSTYPPLYHSLT